MAGTRFQADTPSRQGTTVFCLVPPRLSGIQGRLRQHFSHDPHVEVVIDERAGERRKSQDGGHAGLERRLDPGLGDRRIGERRAWTLPLDQRPSLPPELRDYADELSFVMRPAGAENQQELIRQVAEWRFRCHEAEAEALELARALVGATEHLRGRKPMSPTRFVVLRRAQQAIDRYRHWRSSLV
jgi:hypothetical protein